MERLKQKKSSSTEFMKPFLFIMLLLIGISCKKVNQAAERITITGTVSDTKGNALDSVEVTVKESCFMCMGVLPIETTHSEQGAFKIEFNPRKGQSYRVDFVKKGYSSKIYNVDLYKEIQYVDIIMNERPQKAQ